jgi:hypothetical protein
MLMYARFGRHRGDLGPEFVGRVRAWCEQAEGSPAREAAQEGPPA